MRLSEAIRLGAMLKPQAFGEYNTGNTTCALGAAMDASNLRCSEELHVLWSWIDGTAMCPACADGERHIGHIIAAHLNDRHRWTREQIADWVATVEPAEVGSEAERAVVNDVIPALQAT